MDTAFNLISIEASTTLQLQSVFYTRDTIHWKIGSFFVQIIAKDGKQKKSLFFIHLLLPTLLCCQAETKDALLHAINEEYVEAVEVSCDWLILPQYWPVIG